MSAQRKWHVPLAVAGITAAVILSGCTPGSNLGDLPAELPVAESTSETTTPTTTTTPPRPTPKSDPYTDLDKLINTYALDSQDFWRARDVIFMQFAYPDTDPAMSSCQGRGNPIWRCKGGKIGYDPEAMQRILNQGGTAAVSILVSHESGHFGHEKYDPNRNTGDHAEERLAQCSAGAYMRAVVDGKSKRNSATVEETLRGLDVAYPEGGIPGKVTAKEMTELREAFRAGYLVGEPCLEKV